MRRFLISYFLLICTALPAQQMISLTDCLEMGSRNNPYISNSRLDILSARERRNELVWEFFPTVSIAGIGYYAQNPLLKITPKDILGNSDLAMDISRLYTDFANENGLMTSYSTFRNGYTVSAIATQPLYAGGRIVNGNRLASVGIEVAQLQADMKSRDIREEIETNYWLAFSLQEKMLTLEKAESVIDSVYRFVLSARNAGLAVDSDVSQVSRKRTELASARIKLEGGLKLAKMNLFNSIGYRYEFLKLNDYILSESLDADGPADDPSNYGQPVESRLLEMKEQAAKLEKKVFVGEFLPEVGLGLSYGYGNLQGRDKGLFNGVGFVSVKVPLTGIGKAVARSKRYDYEIEKARNEREYLERQLELQRQQLYLAMDVAKSQLEVSREALEDAKSESRRKMADYKAGRIPVADFLQSELDYRVASEKYIDDCIEYRKSKGAYARRFLSTD